MIATATRICRARRLVPLALLALSALGAGQATAATVTKDGVSSGIAGFPTMPGGLGVYEAGAPPAPGEQPDAVREVGTYAVVVAAETAAEAPFAGRWSAYAVTDIRYHTDNGVPADMVLQLAADAWAGEYPPDVAAKLTWLLRNAQGLIAAEANPAAAAAAVQVVVWQTLRNPPALEPRANLVTPTTSPTVNALAQKFTGMMDQSFAATETDLALGAGPRTGCTSTITLRGTPGTPVLLSIDNGGVLSQSVVVIGPDGTGTVAATAPIGTLVTVAARVASGGVLVRADGVHETDAHVAPTHRTQAPEELIFLSGAQQQAAAVAITCPPPPPAITPDAPPVKSSGGPLTPITSPALALTKVGPRSARGGAVVRYRIVVINTGRVAASAVTVRDLLPGGFTLVRRPAGTKLVAGAVIWSLGTLEPGERRVLNVTARIDRSAAGRRCNIAIAQAVSLTPVRAEACTSVRAVAGVARLPAVTG